MATAAQRWLNRRRRLDAHQITGRYNDGDLVIAMCDDMVCGIRKGDVGVVESCVFPPGSSYRVTFEGEHIFWGKHTSAVPIEDINLR